MMLSRVFSLNLDVASSKDQQISEVVTHATPQEVPLFRNRSIRQIACGSQQTVFVLGDGTVYTHNSEQGDVIPERMSSLDTFSIVQAACGDGHSVVLSNKGHIISWGHDLKGQCGHGTVSNSLKPRVIKSLSMEFIIQVSCGSNHTLALAKSGKVFAWGDNSRFQLGFSTNPEHTCAKPTKIACLSDLPIKQISCGGDHSLALTFSGTVFGWGCNESGQLGQYDATASIRKGGATTMNQSTGPPYPDFKAVKGTDTITSHGVSKLIETEWHAISAMPAYIDKSFEELRYEYRSISVSTLPHKLDFLRDKQISHIVCGQHHSVFLSLTGMVISFGKDSKGTIDNWAQRFVELKEDKKIICGKQHTLAFIPSSNNLYIFGPKSKDDSNLTLVVVHESLYKYMYGETVDINQSSVVYNIFCGGSTCYFAISESPSNKECNPNSGKENEQFSSEMIYHLDEKSISQLTAISNLSVVPKNIAIIIQKLFSSSACLNRSFLTSDHYCCSEENPGFDLVRARKALKTLSSKHNILIQISQVIHSQLCPSLSESPTDVEAIRLYLLLMECPTMQFPELYLRSIFSITKAMCKLSPEMSKVIDTWIGNLLPEHLQHLISIFKNVIVYLVLKQMESTTLLIFKPEFNINIALDMLKKLYKINEEKKEIVLYTSFYVPEMKLLLEWLHAHGLQQVINIYDYPFILENNVKMQIIVYDSLVKKEIAMRDEMQLQMFNQMMMGNMLLNPAFVTPLVLTINRQNIVASTLMQLNSQQQDFMKPLKVKFENEHGIDDGGVRKEFFLLVFKEILDPKFGMFKEFSKAQTIWFNPQSFEDRSMFRLVGVLCGLAIYNQVIVDLPFPLALYKKLLKRPVYLTDFKELDEGMAGSLQDLLDYDDYDLQDVFELYFQISTEFLGQVRIVDLKKGGMDIPVTYDNKQEYVDLYIDYIFNESVKDQYSAFAEGFLQVCGGPVLQMFHPQELMAMVVGNDIYDWEEFERLVEYRGIFNKEHKTIKFFWEVFHEFTLQEKKKFLAFLTGSDRIPVQGMSQLKVIFQPVFGSTDFLPAAHTCFNYLDLPLYESKEKMREKLMKTLEYAQGFGLL
ncbi:probable E3 ubiquitin-protein ligase HERC3 isoform X2 [Anneissia japonica]|uniref:probable E3 ubiquitin-protein ligase HERC3 isoform X2 n=1 Tax=Anneissia japonica TaxID=1529436 RepID=UPI001425636C|nr:probable E3 ubiquitin-protein ligase HERC3 isoform X2 [Anneissia japonica]